MDSCFSIWRRWSHIWRRGHENSCPRRQYFGHHMPPYWILKYLNSPSRENCPDESIGVLGAFPLATPAPEQARVSFCYVSTSHPHVPPPSLVVVWCLLLPLQPAAASSFTMAWIPCMHSRLPSRTMGVADGWCCWRGTDATSERATRGTTTPTPSRMCTITMNWRGWMCTIAIGQREGLRGETGDHRDVGPDRFPSAQVGAEIIIFGEEYSQ